MSLKIVKSICALLNLGDEGKISSFFGRQIKQLNKDKEALEHNLKNKIFNHERTMSTLQDQLEDAKEAKENAYLNVDVEQMTTNASQDSYANIYWSRIENAAEKVQIIQQQIIETEEDYDDEVAEINEQISEVEARIEKLSATEDVVTES